MPIIHIYEKDNTSSDIVTEAQRVFIPVKATLPDDTNISAAATKLPNNCIFYPTPQSYDNSSEYVKHVLGAGLEAIVHYTGDTEISNDSNFSFLLDRDTYDVKFLTSGVVPALQVVDNASNVSSGLFNKLSNIAATRGDCAVIAAFDVGNTSLSAAKVLLDNDSASHLVTSDAKRGAAFATQLILENASDPDNSPYKIDSYSDLAYLAAFGDALKNGKQWEAVAGVIRGQAPDFNSQALVSKYSLDNDVMKITSENSGYSFNGICTVRPSGKTIWGDRTLNKNGNEVTASSFLSIRNIISDIAKRAYNQSIRYTFETNNEVTWANFKNGLVDLLDQMVQAQVLATYKIIKTPAKERATISCQIHISPYGPVENFDVMIVLNDEGLNVNMVE